MKHGGRDSQNNDTSALAYKFPVLMLSLLFSSNSRSKSFSGHQSLVERPEVFPALEHAFLLDRSLLLEPYRGADDSASLSRSSRVVL